MKRPAPAKHLLIDSYNIIHAWPELKKELKKRPRTICQQLLQHIRVIHDMEGLRLTLVIDGKGKTPTIEEPEPGNAIAFLYSPGHISADGMIEHIVCHSKSKAALYVATQDQALAQNVIINGAFVVSPEELQAWVKRCHQTQEGMLTQLRSKDQRKFYSQNLS